MRKKNGLVLFITFAGLSVGFAERINEWTFERDPAGITLSAATNRGSEAAQFSAGGTGILETDGHGGLVCTGTATGSGGMWTNGIQLNAGVIHPPSDIQYLRYDLQYNLSDSRDDSGSVFGMAFTDAAGAQIAGVYFLSENDTALPVGRAGTQVAGGLASVGKVSVIMRVNTGTHTADIWYDLSGTNNFSPSPSLSGVSIDLSFINKLRLHATGDFRPAGSVDQSTVENIRTASTWEEIAAPISPLLSVHSIFQDHMVLQRDMNVPIWGHAAPNTVVVIKLNGVPVATPTADSTGRWLSNIGAHANDGGLAHVLLISSADEPDIQFSDVVFGDVYLVSGQSNMARTLSDGSPLVTAATEEIAAANYPLIRHLTLQTNAVDAKLEEPVLKYDWTACAPANAGSLSAVGYFFARRVHLSTGVPIGLLCCAWGERFIAPEGMPPVPELAGMRQNVDQGSLTGINKPVFQPS